MAEYLLSVWHDGTLPDVTEAEMNEMFASVDRFNKKLQAGGYWVFAGGLELPSAAKVVDATGGDVLTIDGPYAESKEFIGGFWVVNAKDLDEALGLAAEGSKACRGKVEVRPFQGA
ncbi:MAG: YciI family protein [Nocardiaceae bacterium]|nr:YciI family protein [Nocardiaceae bacterium]